MAALASYHVLSCRQNSFHVATHFGFFPDIFCAGKDKVFSFLQDVLDETLEIFPPLMFTSAEMRRRKTAGRTVSTADGASMRTD
jgi:hypothetical protein